MSVPYKNPISSVQVSTPQSVSRTSVFGTNFSILNVGGFMEVFNLSDLSLTLTATSYPSLIQLSANTIPIRYTKGNGTFLSPDYLTLNSDNISSGRRRLGMLVYVHETDTVYQYVIPNYDTLWNNLSGLTGFSSVTYSDYTTVINSRSSAGQSFISGWTSSNIEGVSGFTSTNSNWRVFQRGGDTSGQYLPLSGGTVYGPTIFSSGLTANTLNVTGLTQTKGITSTGGITFPQYTINSVYTATTNDYLIDVTGGTFSVQLPSAVGIQGRLLVVKNNGGGAVTVQPISAQTIDDKPYLILSETNSVQLASNGYNWVILGQDRSTVNNSTGVFSFTGLSKVSSTQFYVAPVKGWIVDDTTNPLSPQILYVDYSGGTHTDSYVNTANETFVYLTSATTIGQKTTILTEQERRQNIFLGKLGHPDKTTINLVFSQPDFVLSPLAQLRDIFQPINLINGGVYPSANTGLTINTSFGYLYGLGINFAVSTLNPNSLTIPATNPCTFQYRTQTGGSITNVTNIDPLYYDVGGVKTAVTGTKATNQRIYLLQNGTFRIQYGQHEYNNFADAVQALQTETFTVFPNFTNNAILIGILTVLSTATDLTDTSKAKFFFSSKFGETVGAAGGVSTTNLQQAYNNSTNPEIVISSTLDGLSIKNGTGNPDSSTTLIEGLNTAGTTTSFIRADGLFSGSSVSTPGFRANTNGLTATTISATTYQNLPTDVRVTGGTYSNNNFTYTNNTGGTFSVLFNTVTGLTANTLTVTGTTFNGNGTFTKTGYNTGDILLDNSSNDTPGILFYYANNSNYGIDSWNGSFDVLSGQLVRITNKLNETGGAVKMAIDTSGNAVFTGFVKPSAWRAGQTIQTLLYNASDLGFTSNYTNNTNTYTSIVSGTYTPLSNLSYIFFEVYAMYDVGGAAADSFFSQITWNGAEIGVQRQVWANGSGGGTRSATLFPLAGRVTNSSLTGYAWAVNTRRDSSDDGITVYPNAGFYVKITEIAR